MQAPNSNHSAHSWWPRWSTGSQLQGKSQHNGRLAYQTQNNTQYINIPILCLNIFAISWDIYHVRNHGNPVFWIRMWDLRIHAYQTKRPLSMTKWWLLVMLTISEIIYQPWPCISSPRWICKILCTWNPPQWGCFVDFLRGNKTCQEILCAYYITLHFMYACMHSAYVLNCAHDSDTIICIQFMLICICSCVWVWWENAKWLSNDYRMCARAEHSMRNPSPSRWKMLLKTAGAIK